MTFNEIIDRIEIHELEHEPSGFPRVRTGFLSAIKDKLLEQESILRNLALSLGVGGYNSEDFDAQKYYEKISWGIDDFAKDYHRLQLDLAANKV